MWRWGSASKKAKGIGDVNLALSCADVEDLHHETASDANSDAMKTQRKEHSLGAILGQQADGEHHLRQRVQREVT